MILKYPYPPINLNTPAHTPNSENTAISSPISKSLPLILTASPEIYTYCLGAVSGSIAELRLK